MPPCLEFDRMLIEGVPITDATVFFEGGLWWLFCTHVGSVELHVYHAKTLHGESTAHTLNPVKREVSSSRPAGPPYRRRGDLYRPAQDCSITFGGGVTINRVLELAPDRFREGSCAASVRRRPGRIHTAFTRSMS
jgi:hypothetical protein